MQGASNKFSVTLLFGTFKDYQIATEWITRIGSQVERVVLNALAIGGSAAYNFLDPSSVAKNLAFRRLPSSSEKPIHLDLLRRAGKLCGCRFPRSK
jgi:hypothetical protein